MIFGLRFFLIELARVRACIRARIIIAYYNNVKIRRPICVWIMRLDMCMDSAIRYAYG